MECHRSSVAVFVNWKVLEVIIRYKDHTVVGETDIRRVRPLSYPSMLLVRLIALFPFTTRELA